MRILVFSDTHGDYKSINQAVITQPAAEVIIHCGDGEDQAQFIKNNYKDKMVINVKGNCDLFSNLNTTQTITIMDKKIFITHGHTYNAKMGIYSLICAAREQDADILLFGHTHNALKDYNEGLHILNPGTCRGIYATYAYIDITDKGIFTNILDVYKNIK